MSLVIRLTRMGKKGERKFRIVVKEKRSRRDGIAVETLGWYHKKAGNKDLHRLDKERFSYWVKQGAKPSPTVAQIASNE